MMQYHSGERDEVEWPVEMKSDIKCLVHHVNLHVQ
jgi:hypothetical protein